MTPPLVCAPRAKRRNSSASPSTPWPGGAFSAADRPSSSFPALSRPSCDIAAKISSVSFALTFARRHRRDVLIVGVGVGVGVGDDNELRRRASDVLARGVLQ